MEDRKATQGRQRTQRIVFLDADFCQKIIISGNLNADNMDTASAKGLGLNNS